MKRTIMYKFVSWLSIMAILCATILCGCTSSKKEKKESKLCEYVTVGEDITEQVKDLSADVLLLESSKYNLVMGQEGILKVVDENNRVFWSSGSIDMQDSSGGESLSSAIIKYSANNVAKEKGSYSDSYNKQQFRIYRNGDTIVYEQIIGDFMEDMLIPEALSEERFAEITAQMSKKEASYISRQYILYEPGESDKDILEKVPDLKNKAYYILPQSDSQAQRNRVHSAFLAAGYTKKDLENDRVSAGISNANQGEVFKIVMNFTLQNDQLTVEIPCDQIYYPDSMPIENMSLFKYGQFALSDSQGSYIVPSGSGAQFDFSNKKNVNYKLQFDGKDYSNLNSNVETDYSSHPIFGAIFGDVGCVGIIEEGSEIVQLNIEGVSEGYVQYPELMLTPYKMSDAGRGAIKHAEKSFDGNLKIRYCFLSDENANYSRMAECYRKYLEEIGSFKNKVMNDDIPFEMEIINSIFTRNYVAGVTYNTEKSVTSFDETKEMLQWSSDNGIENIWIKLSGANKRGLFAQSPGKFKISNKAGGKKNYTSLKNYCEEIDAKMFLSVNMPFYYADTSNDGYRQNKDTTREINQKQVQIYLQEKSTLQKQMDLSALEVVSPSKFIGYSNGYAKDSDVLGSGISVGELTRTINSDFLAGKYFSRSDTKETIKKSLDILQKSYKILAEDPSAYALGSVYGIEKMPLQSSGYGIFERDIPLIPLAIHGKIQYVSTYWNDQPDMKKAQLKAIEYGSGIAYRFAYNVLKDDVCDQNSFLYNVDYLLWRDTAAENHKYISEALDGLNDVAIKNHTYITEESVKVEYENGTVIYINYDDVPVNVDGFTVEANSYFRV